MRNFSLTILMTISIYFLLTLPHLITILTMDIDTGHYYGLVYPTWLIFTCSAISVILGRFLVYKLEKFNNE
jgi:hypothetical protein